MPRLKMRKWERKKVRSWEGEKVGSGTRRRPIRRDYAADRDAASGLSELQAIGSTLSPSCKLYEQEAGL